MAARFIGYLEMAGVKYVPLLHAMGVPYISIGKEDYIDGST